MSRHISLLLLKNYGKKLSSFSSLNRFNHLLSAHPLNTSSTHRQSSQAGPLKLSNQPQSLPDQLQPVDEILSLVKNGEVYSPAESVSLLKVLRIHTLFNGVEAGSFRDDARFRELCDAFERNCYRMSTSLLVSGLRSLLEVGLPHDSTSIVAAQEAILERIHHFSVLNLIGCLYYHHKFAETVLQRRVVERLVSEIQRRAREITSPSEVLMLVHVYHLFRLPPGTGLLSGSRPFQVDLLETKIVELVPSLKTQEMCKLLGTMGEKSIRNVPILNAVSYYLQRRTEKPSLEDAVDMLYVFKKLNFYDPVLFSHLLDHLPSQIPSARQTSLVSGLLTVCGHVRWRHTGILEACGEWMRENFDACRTRELVAFVLSTAALNHCTAETEAVLESIVPQLTPDSVKSPSVLLDVVWSLAILNNIPKDLLLSVLSMDFYKSLAGGSSAASDSHRLKLLNLKGVLRKKYPECVFRCDLYLEPVKLAESPTIENCRQHVLKVLSNFVPKDNFLSTNQVSDTGVFIDAELIMSKNMKPLSLQEYGTLAQKTSPVKELPKDSKRLALLILFHKDVTHCTQLLTGVNAMGSRLLSDAGYTVVTILYNEFSENKTELQKAKYLMQRIKNCIANAS